MRVSALQRCAATEGGDAEDVEAAPPPIFRQRPHTPRSRVSLLRRRELLGGGRANAAAVRSSLGFGATMVQSLARVGAEGLCDPDTSLWHQGCVNAAAWSHCGARLLTGSDDRRCKIWSARDGFPLEEGGVIRTGHRHNIFHCSFVEQASDRQILTCAADGQLRISDICAAAAPLGVARGSSTGRLLHSGQGMMFMFAWIPRVPAVLTAQEDGEVWRVDLREPKPQTFLKRRSPRDRGE
jgi:hypothetical protein|eukprot:COSAG01_NODE_1868_length_9028_cov_3.001232_3_plen_239_part_00